MDVARLFLHPYFDPVPPVRFVKLDVAIVADALLLSFDVFRPAGVPQVTFHHLRSHFGLLGLADRYRLMSLEDLRGRFDALSRLYGSGEDAERVSTRLVEDAGDYENEYGVNHWRALLYRGLAGDDQFCDGGFEVIRAIQ